MGKKASFHMIKHIFHLIKVVICNQRGITPLFINMEGANMSDFVNVAEFYDNYCN